ncbi:L,D-transpeptidase Cds6 family protein [Methylophilus rhizosphaerae]|nr:outer membrane protein assembly factor BamE [Methylophilus rhizosphaerae]
MKPFKMEVQQGNVVTSKMLLQLRPGMTRSQVRYIMGTPLIVDSFRDNRWDYFYELRKQGMLVEKRRVILDFDKDSLVSVRGDVIPSAENPDVKTIAETPQQKAEASKDDSWTDKLKFWKDNEAAAANKAADTTAQVAGATAAAAETKNAGAESAPPAAEPAKATETTTVAETTKAEPAANVADDDEVVPYIPEGEYQAAPTPEEMAKGNLDAAANQATEATANAVNENTLAARASEAVEPPPVFEQEAVPAPAIVAEPEPVLPPPVKATASSAAAPKSVLVPVKPAVAAAPVVAAAAAKTTQSASAETKAAEAKASATKADSDKPATSASAVEDDEVIPYIPEGEYVAPVIPTEGEMVKGNMAEANTPAVDAEAHQVTEKGVAPKVANEAAEPAPTFIAEQMPEPEPEPELPPPPSSVVKPVVKEGAAPVAPATALTAEETKPTPVQPARADHSASATAIATEAKALQPAPAVEAEINKSVAAWAQAWRSKDINAYFAAYAPDFVPDGLPSKGVWEAQRKQRLSTKQGAITLVLNNVQVQHDGGEAVVQFAQKYAARNYKDELLKTLDMRYEPAQKRWLITRERTAPLGSAAVPAVVALPKKTAVAEAQASVEPAVDIPVATEPSVEAALESWAQAWRSKNVKAYLAAYSPEFVPDGLPSKSAWEAQRKKRLSPQQGDIKLEINAVNVERDGDRAVATFTQKYTARAYRDEMVKKLQLKLDPNRKVWLIVRETAASGADLPVPKQQVTAPEDSQEHLDGTLEQIGF